MSAGTTMSVDAEASRRAMRAHEMKNCMTVILAVSQILECELSIESRARMARLQSSVRRLSDLLEEDLAGTTIEPFARAPASPVRVSALVEETAAHATDRAAEAGVRLDVRCGGGELFCDERALREALFNLLANAIESTPPGGTVLVETFLAADEAQQWVVRDAGGGISAEQLATLGQRFHSTKAGGSGVGLAFARAAVSAHGGLLSIESRVGVGTTVSVWLPRRPA